MSEARLERTETGLVPAEPGWFVLNARDAQWLTGPFGAYTRFEGEDRFPAQGFNIAVLRPGESTCYYHAEDEQEDFLVLSGECLLLIDGQERPLQAWDFVHSPPGTEHVFLGAGDGPSVLLGTGTRRGGDIVYPASALAQRHGAGVSEATTSSREAYSGAEADTPTAYRPGWLPD